MAKFGHIARPWPEPEILVVDSIPKGRLFGDLSLKMALKMALKMSLKKSPKTALKICLNGRRRRQMTGLHTFHETAKFQPGCAGRRHLRWKGRNKKLFPR